MVVDKEIFGELAEDILVHGAYKSTKFISNKLTVKATRKRYAGKVLKNEKAIQIMFTIGSPNYEEREKIKQAKKVDESSVDKIVKWTKK